jgi:single-stranded DNA-binding protein
MATCSNCGKQAPGRDINHILLSGEVYSTPTVVPLKNNKRMCIFTLQNNETYETHDGQKRLHKNFLTIEILGKNVDKAIRDLVKGDRVHVTGYVRNDELDGVERSRIRAFNFQKE